VEGRRIVGDRQMIRKTGIGVEAQVCQTATGMDGQESRSGTGLWRGRQVGARHGRQQVSIRGFAGKSCIHTAKIQSGSKCVERRSLYRKGN